MSNNPLVTIIVPVYKAEKYLHYCVDSILAQTYRNLEVILVDDGSPDASGLICDEYAKKDNRIKVLHKANGGASEARNFGLKTANGDYIMHVDSDDRLPAYSITEMIAVAIKENADIVQGCTRKVNSYDEMDNTIPDERIISIYTAQDFVRTSAGGYRTTVWCKLFKSELAKKYSFPVGYYADDVYWNALVLSDDSVKKIVVMHLITYYFTENMSSVTHNLNIQQYCDMEQVLFQLVDVVRNKTTNIEIINTYLLVYLSQHCNRKYDIIIRNAYTKEIRKFFSSNRKQRINELWHSKISL